MKSILKHPSAWLPVTLSLAALAMILASIAIAGVPAAQPEDEGTAAHLFQLWLFLEVLMVAFFAVTWLPRAPKQALLVLMVQIFAILAACFPVFYFQL